MEKQQPFSVSFSYFVSFLRMVFAEEPSGNEVSVVFKSASSSSSPLMRTFVLLENSTEWTQTSQKLLSTEFTWMAFTELERITVMQNANVLKIERRKNRSEEFEESQSLRTVGRFTSFDVNIVSGSIALRSFDSEAQSPRVDLYARDPLSGNWTWRNTLAPTDFELTTQSAEESLTDEKETTEANVHLSEVAIGSDFVVFTSPRYLDFEDGSESSVLGFDLYIGAFDSTCHPFQPVFAPSRDGKCDVNANSASFLNLTDDSKEYSLRQSVSFRGSGQRNETSNDFVFSLFAKRLVCDFSWREEIEISAEGSKRRRRRR